MLRISPMAHQQYLQQLCCVGSRCSPSVPSSTSSELFTDAAWNALLKATGEVTLTVKEVIKSLQDGGNVSKSRQIYGASTKPATKRLFDRLMKVSTQLTSLQTQIMDLKEKTTVLEKKTKSQQDCPQLDVIQKVDDLALTMQEALKRLHEEDEGKSRMICSSKDGKRVSFNLSKPSNSKSSEMEQQRLDILRLTANEEQMRIENERLKKELELALSTKQSESSALEQVERYKEVIARVTADNMVFLMKVL